jgi:hypothetical protein
MNRKQLASGWVLRLGMSTCFPLVLLFHVAGLQNAGALDIIVANNADSGNGTLRQAIQFNESVGGGNRILFSNVVSGAITLTNALGELLITKDLAIIGPGSKVLALSGNDAHRVFNIANANVSISGLTIEHGSTEFGGVGGGLLQQSGYLALADCNVSSNSIDHGSGAGIAAGGVVLATGCTFLGNSCYMGAGIFAGGTFTAVNCTIFGNTARQLGGGIDQYAGSLFLTNCTISGNTGPFIYGGGIVNAGGTATLRNTIVAGNFPDGSDGTSPDCYGAFLSAGFNLIGKFDGSTGWGALGDQVGTTNSPVNPVLGPLQDNGGPTLTLAPQIGSPAIDQGNSGGVLTDQRGQSRPFTNSDVSSIPLGGDRGDIGAIEFRPGDAKIIVVNKADSGDGSLRNAIQLAASNMNVTFAPNVTGTITLTSGELVISKNLSVLGPGAKVLSVDGNNSSRAFHITAGTALLSDLTITNGTNSFGGGIYNQATLTVSNCAVVGNRALRQGGGISSGGVLTAWNTTIAQNQIGGSSSSTAGWGGGLLNLDTGSRMVTLVNCTIASNTAAGGTSPAGGGIFSFDGTLKLTNCTVAGNAVVGGAGAGGGVCNLGSAPGTATAILAGTIVGDNSSTSSPDVSGTFSSGGHNLIGNTSGSAGFGTTSDQLNINPLLGPLADNGGPTRTMALPLGSPAVDKGRSFGLTTDQRGAPRPFDFGSVANADGGDGSDIGAFELGRPSLTIQRAGSNAVVSWPASYGDFALESATNLPTANNWSALAGTPVIVGGQFNVTNSAAGARKYFHLKNK